MFGGFRAAGTSGCGGMAVCEGGAEYGGASVSGDGDGSGAAVDVGGGGCGRFVLA